MWLVDVNGTSRLGEALAIIVCFVDCSTLTIHQHLVRVQLLTKSMTGEEVARELSVVSTEYGGCIQQSLGCNV